MTKLDWKSVRRALSPGQTEETVPYTEHEYLEKWAQEVYDKFGEGGVAIEIGSYYGASTVLLAQFFTVIAFDLWYPLESYQFDYAGDTFPEFVQNMNKFSLLETGRVVPILGISNQLDLFPADNAKLCFIDGDHDYEPVKNDIRQCDKHLTAGGYMVLHDYPRAGGVKDAVDEFLRDNDNYAKIGSVGDGIIALLKKGLVS
jgi:cephalosporin hydroxylase